MNEKAKILRGYRRMCNTSNCGGCKLYEGNNKYGQCCDIFTEQHPEEAVEIIEAWVKEHPDRTYLTDFLEKYPNALKNSNGTPKSCACDLGYVKGCPNSDGGSCVECWNTPMEG